jgi:hypothetical protein
VPRVLKASQGRWNGQFQDSSVLVKDRRRRLVIGPMAAVRDVVKMQGESLGADGPVVPADADADTPFPSWYNTGSTTRLRDRASGMPSSRTRNCA